MNDEQQENEDRPSREFVVSSFSTIRDTRTIDYHERNLIFESIRERIIQLKIAAGMACEWPRRKKPTK